jgi:hypothetical protein
MFPHMQTNTFCGTFGYAFATAGTGFGDFVGLLALTADSLKLAGLFT